MNIEKINIFIGGLELEVTFAYYPSSKGCRDSYGVPLEPDEDESIEIQNVVLVCNEEDVSSEDIEQILNNTERIMYQVLTELGE